MAAVSPVAHHPDRCLVPIEVRPHICTALAAGPAGEALLDIGQPDSIGPAIAADRDGVAAAVVGAIDQQPTHAHSRISAKVIFCGLERLRGGGVNGSESIVQHKELARPVREPTGESFSSG